MRIGQAAVSTGLSIDTIRFYEREGLIPQRERNAAGYRLYRDQDIRKLRSIGRAQGLGFTLHEIRELFLLDEIRDDGCAHVQEMIVTKLKQVKDKLESLRQIEESLSRAQARCHAVRSNREQCRCPVLEHLNDD